MITSHPILTDSVSDAEGSSLAAALARGIVRSERYRVAILAAVLVIFMGVIVWLAVGPAMISSDLAERLRGALPTFLGFLGTCLLYEAAAWVWLGSLIQKEREPTMPARYFNAIIESSIFTVVLFAARPAIGALDALSGAAPWGYFPFLVLSALNLNFRLCAVSGLVSAVGFTVFSLDAIRNLPPLADIPVLTSVAPYVVKAEILLICGLAAGFVAARLKNQLLDALKAGRERDRAVGIFGQHVSPQVAERLLSQPLDTGGEERPVCVMFLDIRDFSRFAGKSSPGEVMEYLNCLFGEMIDTVNDCSGFINKFLGDGFMAVFGAPANDPQACPHGVRCAFALLAVVEDLCASGKIPPTRIGIGLHVGPAITGNVGSEHRKEYTVIGDTVNLAARIEQATKQFGASLLVSEAVLNALGSERPEAVDLGEIELKGQARPVRLFKLR